MLIHTGTYTKINKNISHSKQTIKALLFLEYIQYIETCQLEFRGQYLSKWTETTEPKKICIYIKLQLHTIQRNNVA